MTDKCKKCKCKLIVPAWTYCQPCENEIRKERAAKIRAAKGKKPDTYAHLKTKEKSNKYLKLYIQGKTLKEISEEFGVSAPFITRVIVKYNLEGYYSEKEKRRKALFTMSKCPCCGEKFETRFDRGKKYCSRECQIESVKYVSSFVVKDDRKRQRIRMRMRYEMNPDFREMLKQKRQERDSTEEGKLKNAARRSVRWALLSGKMIKPTICEHCGKDSSKGEVKRIEAHHHDYSKKLEVEWLCSPCHYKEDKRIGTR